ncbi:Gfo/Idh/MocA family protein [Desulforhopalus sp. 52FAK]
MQKRTIRFGIVGPGSIGHSHCRAIQQSQGAELVSVLGRDILKTREFANKYGITPYIDEKRFLSENTLDAIAIATPSGAHLEIALPAAAQGTHILCEKPLEVTPERCQTIIDSCREAKVQLGIIFQGRFEPAVLLAKEAIDRGRLGQILLASCQMRWSRNQAYYDSAPWRGTWALDGGGCLMNQGIHSIDLLLYLAGDVASVSAFQGPVTHQRIEVEDTICASVRFVNGAVGTIEGSTSCEPGLPRKIEISGEKGTICIEDNRIVRWEFKDSKPEDEDILRRFKYSDDGCGGAADPKINDVTGHTRVINNFVTGLVEKRDPFISGEEGKRSVEVICTIYSSMGKEGRVVSLVPYS